MRVDAKTIRACVNPPDVDEEKRLSVFTLLTRYRLYQTLPKSVLSWQIIHGQLSIRSSNT